MIEWDGEAIAAHARSTDPETSREAAHSVQNIRATQNDVLALFVAFGPMNDDMMIGRAREIHLPQSVSGLRTRRSELVRLRKLRDSGSRTLTASGRRSIVWEHAS